MICCEVRILNSAATIRRLGVAVIVAAVCAVAIFIVWWVSSSSRARPDIFLLCIDTLRSDATGCSLPQESFTPRIDEVAKDSIVFEYTLSQSASTSPSIASLFTSRLTFEFGLDPIRKDYLAPRFHTWAEWLRDLGYDTHAVITNPWLTSYLGFAQGFNSYDLRLKAESAEVTEYGTSLLDSLDKGPRFVWLHYWYPHDPYRRHEEFLPEKLASYDGPYRESFGGRELKKFWDPNLLLPEEDLDYVRWMYNCETRLTDRAVGTFIETLQDRGLYTDSLIVICSDHGEEFQEHRGIAHAHAVYEEVIHVPLIVKLPRNRLAGTRVNTRVRLMDVLPTVSDVLDEVFPETLVGESLLPLAEGTGVPADREVISTADYHHACVYLDNWKYVLSKAILVAEGDDIPIPKERQDELFDMSSDRAERLNRAHGLPERVSLLRRTLDVAKQGGATDLPQAKPEDVFDEETLDMLRSLGYIK